MRASEALDATDMDWAMKGRRRSGWKEPRRRHGWTSQWRGMMCDTTAFSSEGTKKAPLFCCAPPRHARMILGDDSDEGDGGCSDEGDGARGCSDDDGIESISPSRAAAHWRN